MAKKILVVVGGKNPAHSRDASLFKELFGGFNSIHNIDLSLLSKETLMVYDTVIISTSLESAGYADLNSLVEFASYRDKLLVLLHEAIIYDRSHEAFKKLVGARFKNDEACREIKVEVKKHRITDGLEEEFSIYDEVYFYDSLELIERNCEVFLYRQEDKYPLGFMRKLPNNSKMACISLGHGEESRSNKNFIQLISNLKGI